MIESTNMSQAKYKRVLLKVGGESLLGDREYGISHEAALSVGALAALQLRREKEFRPRPLEINQLYHLMPQ